LKEFDSQYSQPEQTEPQGEGLLHKLFVQPYETTLGNIGALGQVGLSSLVGKFNPQASAQIAQEGAFGKNVQERSQMASEKPLQALWEQGLASADIYGQAMGLKALTSPGALNTAKSVATKGKGVVKTVANPKKAIVDARNTAAMGKKINKVKILKGAKEVALDNPGAEREFTKVIKPQLEKIKDANDLLKKIDRWNKKAFLRGGGMKSSHAADLYGDILKLMRGELQRVAPEAAKYQKVLQLGHTVPKTISKATWLGAKAGGIAYLANMLGL